MIKYEKESYHQVIGEIKPLLEDHWEEIAHYKDIALSPDYRRYKKLEDLGILRVYTLRKDGKLVGYGIYFVQEHIHYKQMTVAAQDILYVSKDMRGGQGYLFIKWCDEQLKEEGVTVVTQHIKAKHNFGKMLERLNYELMDLIYTRRIN